ncbi:MAG: hypothetical protein MI749_15455 [Desulfovibrionales bacterium]|nr:hypothetical protein [Desulfovibrionales bacterium]
MSERVPIAPERAEESLRAFVTGIPSLGVSSKRCGHPACCSKGIVIGCLPAPGDTGELDAPMIGKAMPC